MGGEDGAVGGACVRVGFRAIVVGPVSVNADSPVVRASLYVSMVVEGNHGDRGVLP